MSGGEGLVEVQLKRAPEWRGWVVEWDRSGNAKVAFEGGGHGWFAVADVEPVDDKAWPPPGMETK